MIQFTVYGPIKGKARARVTTSKNGKVFAFTPKNTLDFENRIRAYATEVKPLSPIQGPVAMELNCYFLIPKTKIKKDKSLQPRYKISKPDSSNILKAVEDALNKIIYHDDAQIVDTRVRREYTEEQERIEVKIMPIGD